MKAPRSKCWTALPADPLRESGQERSADCKYFLIDRIGEAIAGALQVLHVRGCWRYAPSRGANLNTKAFAGRGTKQNDRDDEWISLTKTLPTGAGTPSL